MRLLIVLFLVPLSGFAQAWPQEPTTIRGVAFGAGEKEFKKAWGEVGCGGREYYPKNISICTSGTRTLPVHPAQRVKAWGLFEDDQLREVEIYFSSARWEFVKIVFTERFGAPPGREETDFLLPSGLTVKNEEFVWRGERAVVRLRKFDNYQAESLGAATFAARPWDDDRTRREREVLARNAGSEF